MSLNKQRGFIGTGKKRGGRGGGDEYDLRYFRWLVHSNAWDGTSPVEDGWVVQALIYRGTCVYQESFRFKLGRQIACEAQGNASLVPLSHAGMAYLDTWKRVRHMFDIEPMNDFSPLVLLDRSTYTILSNHVQFSQLEQFCAERGRTFSLQFVDEEHHEIVLT